MEQYRVLKEQCGDSILFFHIGDFYETFGSDAETISRELDIVLTSRSKGSNGERVPLAGVPCHAADAYIARLVKKGYRVAICDQVGDAKENKGIVNRQLTRVITPGTVIDPAMITSPAATYLMAVTEDRNTRVISAAFLDITTGEFFYAVCPVENGYQAFDAEIAKYHPGECIVSDDDTEAIVSLLHDRGITVTLRNEEAFTNSNAKSALMSHFGVVSLEGFGLSALPSAVRAAGAALIYARETQGRELSHITTLSDRSGAGLMMLDAVTLRNLELIANIRDGGDDGTLKKTIDLTKTPMGTRLLVRWLTNPLTDPDAINDRLDAVEFFADRAPVRSALSDFLSRCTDIARIAGRISYGNANPRDLTTLASSLKTIPDVRELFFQPETIIPKALQDALACLADHRETIELISRAIVDDPPPVVKNGGVIRPGYDAELDGFRHVSGSGKDWIVRFQQDERDRTGIKSLKVGYTSVFGYYIEVTRPNLPNVPPEYERKQTTSTGERFTVPTLREKEAAITHADERQAARENVLYTALIRTLAEDVKALKTTAEGIAVLDLYRALAETARKNHYVRPNVDGAMNHLVRDGRHPVVEQRMSGGFVPNDVVVDVGGEQILIITGANMAGKSTYMRSVALITILAQMGSYVPASFAQVGVVDRIFTRVGAFDDLASGQSTFMVEMLELANILNNVTKRSLVILDEIGRGTSTLDGFCIAKAVLEFLHGKGNSGPRTLFATHFHEIVGVESELKRVKNYHFAVRDTGVEVIFLRKLIPGATDRSYGIHVARIAGVPRKVIDRATSIMDEVGSTEMHPSGKVRKYTQVLLFDAPARGPDPVSLELEALSLDGMTPIEALKTLYDLRQKVRKGPGSGTCPDRADTEATKNGAQGIESPGKKNPHPDPESGGDY
jgi:DNA mismatch repair protein MutS